MQTTKTTKPPCEGKQEPFQFQGQAFFHCIVDSQPNAGTNVSRVDAKKGTHRVTDFDVKTASQWRISC
jgi:hypothetical protein